MRKNLLRTLVAALLIFSLMGATAFAEDYTVTGNAVNLRAGPGTEYRILDTLPGGTVVNVTDRSNGSWYAVSYRGQSGYMSASYLRVLEAAAPATVIPSVPEQSSEGSAVIILDGAIGGGNSYAEPVGGSTVITVPSADPAQATPLPADDPAPSASIVYPSVPAESDAGSVTIILDGTLASSAAAAPAAGASSDNVGKSGTIKGDFVCFRTGPSSSNSIITTYNRGKELVITSEANGWFGCTIDGRQGYVAAQYVTVGAQAAAPAASAPASSGSSVTTTVTTVTTPAAAGSAGYIAGNNVRLRSGPSMGAGILTELFYGNAVTITGKSGDWTAVVYNGRAGYVYSQYVKSGSFQQSGGSTGSSAGSTVSAPAAGSVTGQQIANYALQFVGYRYVWGGKSPETGFDCSGFVMYVYSQFGYTLNRVAGDQAKNGVPVSIDSLQPGDVLCFYSSSDYIGHTGIYIGNNRFVHASTSTTGVIISELSGYYQERGYVARRIV